MPGRELQQGIRQVFSDWMEENTPLAISSINKYDNALKITSKEMLDAGVIDKGLLLMPMNELDTAISAILANGAFKEKNKRGNNMYSCALKQFRCYMSDALSEADSITADLEQIEHDENLSPTERLEFRWAREGQGRFRKNLMKKYSEQCIITGVTIPEVLVASHIKPWTVSSYEERLSAENGLLLSATYAKLFQKGLISFKDNGGLMISNNINVGNRARLGLEKGTVYDIKPTNELVSYLEYHRDVVWVK